MRISSLARKIKVKPSELIVYCEQNAIELDSGAHSKLSPDQVEKIYAEFAPEFLPQEDKTLEAPVGETPEPIDVPEPTEEVLEASNEPLPPKEEPAMVEEEATQEPVSDKTTEKEEEVTEEEVEVIRAPKITLPGLKVKGKIDLPEPKKPEPKEEKQHQEEKNQSKKKSERKKKGKNGEDYNPVAAARKRKQLREEKERIAELNRRKKAKAQHYYKIQQKVAKTKQEKSKEQSAGSTRSNTSQDLAAPKNIFQRFWRWFNT
ncbi:MAG: hypothetical protein RIA62_17915 [Cyclobacteriaceae bacterium]